LSQLPPDPAQRNTLPRTDASPTLAIQTRDVAFVYGDRRALNGLTLAVPAGGVFGLLGPNGSGKSTLISLLAAQERPPEGQLTVFGEAPKASLRRRIGTVFQENTADPLMTVFENLHLAGRLFGLERSLLNSRIPDLLATFGLSDRAHDPTATLSGGMRRRLEVARSLLHQPELLLLDEPTTGVDAGERRALWDALIASRGKRTVLLATNDLAEADTVCDQVAFIEAGRVVTAGTPDDLKRGLLRESIRITWPGAAANHLDELRAWPETGTVLVDADFVHVTVDDASAFVPRLFALAGPSIRGITIHASSLEDAYFHHVRGSSGAAMSA